MPTDWQRSSPIAGVYFLISNLRTAVNLWPAVAGMLALEQLRGLFLSIGLPVLAILLVAVSGLQWWFFGFRYSDSQVQLRSGVVNRKQLTLDFDRVQEVNLEQALYYRLFGLWSLDLESAGSKAKEVHIPGLKQARAEDIRARFLAYKRDNLAEPEQPDDAEGSPDYRLPLNPAELARFGLMHNTLLYIVPVVGGALSQSQPLMELIADWLEGLPFLTWLAEFASMQDTRVQIALAAAVFVTLLALVYGLSILGAIVKFWRYTLEVEGERFQYSAGLFHRMHRGFKLHKMQSVIVKQGIVARLLGRYTLQIQQTNDYAGSGQGMSGGFMVPVLDAQALQRIKSRIGLRESSWHVTRPIRIFWNTVVYGCLATAAIAVVAVISASDGVVYAPLAFPVLALWFWARWRKTRYFVGDDWMAVQTGLIGTRTTYVPVIKVQKLQLAEGPLLRWHRAARLKIWSGSSTVTIGFVSRLRLNRVYDQLLFRVATHRGRWM